jgi:trans-2,3-dihydro-3-hydroxyanthranilate isomerase
MTHRNYTYYIVDVFAENKYSGNQLAVFIDARNISSEEMASMARETNYSETTFITACNVVDRVVDVRIFTPGGEIPFAGHPTLGTAYIANKVFFEGKADSITLNLKVGKIPVVADNDLLWMNQVQPIFGQTFNQDAMASVLGINSDEINSKFPIEYVSTGLPFFIVPVKSLKTLISIKPNLQKALESFKDFDTSQTLVFAPESYSHDDAIACRVFVPALGIPEDPATGSANGCLAAYLVKHSYFGKEPVELSVAQGYEINRPSRLYLKASLLDNVYSIKVGGKVVEIAEGKWY